MITLLIPLVLVLGVHEDALPEASARMQSAPLIPGERLELVVGFQGAPDAWWGDAEDVRVSRPILQIDAPECVRILGAPPADWVTPHDFETNYLRYPYGRKLHEPETKIEFELTGKAEPGVTIGLNLVYWLKNGDPERARFVRRRLELDLAPGAAAVPGDPSRSAWGKHGTLAIGDAADAFTLPSHDEIEVGLEEYVGSWTLIFTYRAHW